MHQFAIENYSRPRDRSVQRVKGITGTVLEESTTLAAAGREWIFSIDTGDECVSEHDIADRPQHEYDDRDYCITAGDLSDR